MSRQHLGHLHAAPERERVREREGGREGGREGEREGGREGGRGGERERYEMRDNRDCVRESRQKDRGDTCD
jgi:hypothetical protein